MSSVTRYECEIAEDIRHQRVVWGIERISWILMILMLIAALSGLLGHGPLSSSVVDATPEIGMEIHYQRFERSQTPSQFVIRLDPGVAGDSIRLTLGSAFTTAVAITEIEPPPDGVTATGSGTTYVFDLPDPVNPATVIVSFVPTGMGRLELSLRLDGYAEQHLTQFVYP